MRAMGSIIGDAGYKQSEGRMFIQRIGASNTSRA